MNVSVYAHIEHDTEASVDTISDGSGGYVVLHVGDDLELFIRSRAKTLELAGLLESAAQKWEASHEHGES